jgi:hypothetical protein
MTYQPASRTPILPEFISPWSWCSLGPKVKAEGLTTPSSGTWWGVLSATYVPLVLPQAYNLQRFWWQNGATVGTDYLTAAIYSVDGSDVLDCVVSSGRILSAGTVNHVQFSGCGVMAHGITSGTSTTDGTSFVTASVTLKARPGLMYALVFINSKASAAEAATTVQTTGAALSFTSRNSQLYGASTEGRVSMWTAVPTADVTDTITISFTGTQTGAAWALVAFTNVDTTTNDGIVQTAVGSGDSTTPLATLGAFGSSNNATFGLNANLADTSTTPGAGFVELYDINYATPTNCLQAQYTSDNDTTSDGTITSGQWGALAAEIKSLGTTRTLAPGRYYMAFWCSGTTATMFRTSSVPATAHDGIYGQGALNTVAYTPVPVALVGTLPNFGITNRASP